MEVITFISKSLIKIYGREYLYCEFLSRNLQQKIRNKLSTIINIENSLKLIMKNGYFSKKKMSELKFEGFAVIFIVQFQLFGNFHLNL